MNYFSHGRIYCDRPYFLAGTAVPDWMSVVNRRIRAKAELAEQHLTHENPALRELAAGIVQHHSDDAWFHQSRAFMELNLQFTGEVRAILPEDRGFRTGFLGHILVELLLDAELISRDPPQLDAYYSAVASIDAVQVADWVSMITKKDANLLATMIRRFCEERFLADYRDDDRLLMRLNHVMRRVRLPQLPREILTMFPTARQRVADRADELMAGD